MGGRLFSQLALAFQIFQERLPLRSATKAIGLYFVRVDELQRIAVVEIVAAIVDDLAVNLSAAEHKVIEHLATDETDAGGSAGKEVFAAQIEVYIGKQRDFLAQRFHRIAEAQFAGVRVEPLDVVVGEKGLFCISSGASSRLTDSKGIEFGIFYWTGRKGLLRFVVVTAASSHRCAGNGYRHHPSEGFVILHILQS